MTESSSSPAEDTEQRGGYRVGAVHEIVAHQGVLGAEYLREYRVQLVPAVVAVAVAVSPLHVDIAYPVVDERL